MRRQSDILLTRKPVMWRVVIDHDMLYERVSQETAVNAKKSQEPVSDDHIILEDDKPLYNYYLSLAISDLTSLLARRIDQAVPVQIEDKEGNVIENQGMIEDDGITEYHLVVDDNFEHHLQTALQNYCFEYVASRVMEMWYKQPQGSEQLRLSIVRTLEFRKKPVRRPIRSML